MRLVGTTIIVRPIVEAELERLERIYAGTPLYFEALGIAEPNSDDVWAQFAAVQSTPGRMLLGIEVPAVDLLIGALDLQLDFPHPGAATIHLLLIWGGFQRQGYGRETLELLVEELLRVRPDITDLRVIAATNEEGLRFWEQFGFMPNGEPAVAPFRNLPAQWLMMEAG